MKYKVECKNLKFEYKYLDTALRMCYQLAKQSNEKAKLKTKTITITMIKE